MGLREDLGGKLEDALNKLVDEHLSAEKLTPLLTGLLEGQVGKLKELIKKDVIDLLDGEDDIK
jgi:hypothetical protein